ncbi:rod shape-determining protein MreD [Phycicoccus sp. MAQZ13P-2]|uniref:rod shape-determining protein MreD n=1 Tax=Phycicoccus mangrovi TaxID=2840470 RepID=UPI001C007C7C|nr:rod shape-determining protein MreD [Phycicoccus mangrovi]MBT9255713.1 rod shape-determining protein MreD [Phycicoccus mangrovi]MBT9274307.1 rod shape-determining protein MreD [Phycicoccus mangrovi]
MMRPLGLLARAALLVVAAVVLAALAARHVRPVPDLVAVLVVGWALWRGPVAGALAGLVGGWALDLVPPGADLLGLHAMAYAGAGLLAGRLRVPGPVGAPRVAAAALAVSGLVAAVDVLRALSVQAPVDLGEVALRVLLTATVAAVLVPVVVRVERAVLRRRFG